ncbi:hypothetical protein [Nocardioides sp. URHA0032]|uniref:hypothetical protein n=1 Tax=Nocardioides sp. URHA0032 TaxID=1380388 RepID=UPI00048EBD5F|nr:hypothetical protein [Nocardioides sp. URHA0032]
MIYSVLRHRATVKRAERTTLNGEPLNVWSVVDGDVWCLLDTIGTQAEASHSSEVQPTRGRTARLLTASGADLRPGDRVTLTRGAVGNFRVTSEPATVSTCAGPHHCEFIVEQVA